MAGKLVHVEMPAKDGNRARKFYSSLLGWEFKDSGMPGLDYSMTEGLEPVVAVFTMPDKKGPVIYFDVEDIDAAIRKVKQLGGEAEDKLPVPGQGWFADCRDTEGNPFSLWINDTSAPMPEQQKVETART